MRWCKVIKEDIKPGYAPSEITFRGYTTKNLHHSADAAKAFQDTIERVGNHHPKEVMAALKATDTYMKLNDMHLEQGGVSPDEKELNQWKMAHQVSRDALNKIGEFMHHEDYWHMHEHEMQDLLTKYNPETAGAEMAEQVQQKPLDELSNELLSRYKTAASAQASAADKAKDFKKGDKRFSGIVKATNKQFANDMKKEEVELDEALTDKTIRSSDKIKVARVIADMLGVEKAESMSPEQAIAQGLRSIKNKRMTPELIGVLKKMLALAQEVGIKIDTNMMPKAVTESSDVVVDKKAKNNMSKGIMNISDFIKSMEMNQGANHTEVAHSMETQDNDHLRRMKAKYKTEEVEKQSEEDHEMSDDDLEKMASGVNHEDHILHLYDDEELAIVDQDTGEEAEEDEKVNEEALMEVLSRSERMKARIRFMRTAPKRQRRLQIVLKKHSDAKTISKRARHLAVKMIKEKLAKKQVSQMSVSEKERVEGIIAKRKALIDRLAMKLVPRIRKIENDRLSHQVKK